MHLGKGWEVIGQLRNAVLLKTNRPHAGKEGERTISFWEGNAVLGGKETETPRDYADSPRLVFDQEWRINQSSKLQEKRVGKNQKKEQLHRY